MWPKDRVWPKGFMFRTPPPPSCGASLKEPYWRLDTSSPEHLHSLIIEDFDRWCAQPTSDWLELRVALRRLCRVVAPTRCAVVPTDTGFVSNSFAERMNLL